MYSDCGNMNDAVSVFIEIWRKSIVSWNSIIVAVRSMGVCHIRSNNSVKQRARWDHFDWLALCSYPLWVSTKRKKAFCLHVNRTKSLVRCCDIVVRGLLGLVSIVEGSIVTVVFEDCHTVIKLILRVVGREIVMQELPYSNHHTEQPKEKYEIWPNNQRIEKLFFFWINIKFIQKKSFWYNICIFKQLEKQDIYEKRLIDGKRRNRRISATKRSKRLWYHVSWINANEDGRWNVDKIFFYSS